MKVYTQVGSTVYVLCKDELWTVNGSLNAENAMELSEKEALATVKDFQELNPNREYWAK